MSKNATAFLVTASAAVLGVLAAGYIMAEFRSSVGIVGKAHSGFDS